MERLGIKGKGKVFAAKFIEQLNSGEKSLVDYVELFPTPDEALLNWRLADCSQVVDGKLKLIEMTDIVDMFDTHYTDVF